ncbi:LysR family transcriptional regulator (plasmid) [Aminobacter sp. P9b]|uniref:DNA-binding transcriptional LysR family regulator n=2 Tax=Aminobacter TaxID=31988 RepID=A0ABR6L6B6_9HYPH|nr:LysR family transcriptional regulator [Aminobacter niigataensis]MBB4652332.1 DNA-binding transcriptional LysR family regulator [Aminobacter niigataensis]CAI2936647.1 protein of unknown function [Aminobacter niigataensis]
MKNVTIKQLRAFVAVAELGRFRLATEHIGVTQSAISVLIKELESQLGVMLFDRHTRMVGLTYAGEIFLPLARRAIEQVDNAINTMDDIASLRTGKVTIAAAIVLASSLLPDVIARFKKEHPLVKVSLLDLPENRIRDLVADGSVDIGVATSRPIEEKVREHHLFYDRFAVFFAKGHPFESGTQVRWIDMEGQDLVGFPPDSPIQKMVDRVLGENEISVNRLFAVNFSSTMLSLVDRGLGVCIAPENSHSLSASTLTEVRPLVEPQLDREVVTLTLRERTPSTPVRSFLDMLIASAAKQYPKVSKPALTVATARSAG